MTNEELINGLIGEIKKHDGDEERQHHASDFTMEELLINLGYKELVDYIRTTRRWYA